MKLAAAVFVLAVSLASVRASDPVGIYAVVDKVVLELAGDKPDRIQIWGTFCLAEGRADDYAEPKRGYLYFKADPDKPDVARAEWLDLKKLAGSDQIVAFGSRRKEKGRIRGTDSELKDPDIYPLGFGLQKIRENHWNGGPVKALRQHREKKSSASRESANAGGH